MERFFWRDTIRLMAEESISQAGRILLVDDDVKLCKYVIEYLKLDGFDVEAVHDGERGLERSVSGNHSLVVLDVMIPGFNGFEVLRRIRAQSNIPVLMLTARGDEIDRVVGLELGADDYLPKPFNPRELVARIRAILRRTACFPDGQLHFTDRQHLVVGDVEMNIGARLVRRAGEIISLTGVEFVLLEALLRSAGSVIPREELSVGVLGRRPTKYDRSLDMHISNIRKKLGHQVGTLERIKTLRGVGYSYTLPCDAITESSTE